METIVNNPLFGLIISLVTFEIGILIYRKTNFPLFNPLLISIILIIAYLKIFDVSLDAYNKSASMIDMFLGPTCVVLAVPLFDKFDLLKKNLVPIIGGIFIGSLVGVISIYLLSKAFGLDSSLLISLLPKSVTTPIGISISDSLGGVTSVTVLAIILTGIVGSVVAPIVYKVFRIHDPIARGVGMGCSAHSVGTSKAFEMGEIEGAMSSLSIGIAGVITVIVVPIIFAVLNGVFK